MLVARAENNWSHSSATRALFSGTDWNRRYENELGACWPLWKVCCETLYHLMYCVSEQLESFGKNDKLFSFLSYHFWYLLPHGAGQTLAFGSFALWDIVRVISVLFLVLQSSALTFPVNGAAWKKKSIFFSIVKNYILAYFLIMYWWNQYFFFHVSFQRGISAWCSLWEKQTSDWQVSSLKRTQKTLKWHEIFTQIKLRYLPKEQGDFWCYYWNTARSTFPFHILSSCQKTQKGMKSIVKEFSLPLTSLFLLTLKSRRFILKSAFLMSSEHFKDIVISG